MVDINVRGGKTGPTNLILFVAVVAIFGFGFVSTLFLRANPAVSVAHVYGEPKDSIASIDLRVFYTVPKDRTTFDFGELESKLEKVLAGVSAFHDSQFIGKSKLSYKIFPKPVVLDNNELFYDTNDTSRGNPHALIAVAEELGRRVFAKTGDLYDAAFLKSSDGDGFRDTAIIYEGVGAAGTTRELILSRDFITRNDYAPISSSLFYHEFGHTMGIPEGYDINTGQPFTNDIMGSGRRAPIEANYIDKATLKQMGVF